jgi:hypothetical protein
VHVRPTPFWEKHLKLTVKIRDLGENDLPFKILVTPLHSVQTHRTVVDIDQSFSFTDLPYWTRKDDENLCSGKDLDSLEKFTRSQREARLAFLKPVKRKYFELS